MKKTIWLFALWANCVWGSIDLTDPKIVIRKLVEANYQVKPELTLLQLFHVDDTFYQKICADVGRLIEENNPSIVTSPYHLSNWSKPEGMITQYSLLNESGRLDDYSTDHNRSLKNKQFAQADKYPDLARFLCLFPHSTNFRINILNMKSRFTQHQEDICFSSKDEHLPVLRVRFHLPIHTNPDAVMVMQGNLYHFEPGILYFFHNGCIHDGINRSQSENRVHLVWDMLLTEDTFHRMFERSIALTGLNPIANPELSPVSHTGIDPEYKKTLRRFSYHHACHSSFCPVQ